LTPGFFHESVSPGPLSIPLGPFQISSENSQRYSQMNVYQPVSMTPGISCLPVSMTPVINPCNGFSVIASVTDTGDKFISIFVDTDEKLTQGPLIRVCGVSIVAPFHGGSNYFVGSHV
jgi:hypothetical protein